MLEEKRSWRKRGDGEEEEMEEQEWMCCLGDTDQPDTDLCSFNGWPMYSGTAIRFQSIRSPGEFVITEQCKCSASLRYSTVQGAVGWKHKGLGSQFDGSQCVGLMAKR